MLVLCLAAVAFVVPPPICHGWPLFNFGGGNTNNAVENNNNNNKSQYWPPIPDAEIEADMLVVRRAIQTPWVEQNGAGLQRMQTKRDSLNMTDAQRALFDRHWELETIQTQEPTAPKQFTLELLVQALDTLVGMDLGDGVVHLFSNKLAEWAKGKDVEEEELMEEEDVDDQQRRQQQDVPMPMPHDDDDKIVPTTTTEIEMVETTTTTNTHVEDLVEGEQPEKEASIVVDTKNGGSYEANESKVFEAIQHLKQEEQEKKNAGNEQQTVKEAALADAESKIQQLDEEKRANVENGISAGEDQQIVDAKNAAEMVKLQPPQQMIEDLLSGGSTNASMGDRESDEAEHEQMDASSEEEEVRPVIVFRVDEEKPKTESSSGGLLGILSRLLFGRKKRDVQLMQMMAPVPEMATDDNGMVVDEFRADELPRGILITTQSVPDNDDTDSLNNDGTGTSSSGGGNVFSMMFQHFKERMAMMHALFVRIFGRANPMPLTTNENAEDEQSDANNTNALESAGNEMTTIAAVATETPKDVDERAAIAKYLFDAMARTQGVKRNEKLAYVWYSELQYWIAKRIEADFGDASKRVGEVLDRFGGTTGEKLAFLRTQWTLTVGRLAMLEHLIGKEFRRRR